MKSDIKERLRVVVEKMAKQQMKKANENKHKSMIREYGRSIASELLRDIVDDLLMQIEMLIDAEYGQVDQKKFKKDYYDISSKFEKQFANILKNMAVTKK